VRPGNKKEKMNRAIYIVMIPVLLVALGYILVFRSVGLAPGYARLIIAVTVFFVVIWWLARKTAHGSKSGRQP
jgi:ABC-type spermidine/putrescine transport system permease subunit II